MKVVRPTNNIQTQGYSANHRGYDHAGLNLPDEVKAGQDGVIIERVDIYNSSWINNGTLTTKDYGNYIKIRHADGSFELHAHLKQGSSLNIGTQVKAGQIVARIGNTGNSTGPHLHSEYRNSENVNISVEFINAPNLPEPPIDPTLQHKASVGDRVWSPFNFNGKTIVQSTEKDNLEFVAWIKSNVGRAGKWDKLAQLAGFTGSTENITIKEMYDKIKGQGNVGNLKTDILEFLKKY